jgi:hypothetical protein
MSSLPRSSLPPLPTASPWLLLRALFKRAAPPSTQPLSTSYLLDRIDVDHVRRYNEAFGFPAGSVPLTYLYLLAQRAQLATMLDCAIPFRIPGLIHVANELTMQSVVRPHSPLLLTTTLSVPEPGANGAVECILKTLATDGKQTVFTCASRYLIKRGQRKQRAIASPSAESMGEIVGQWVVDLNAGRRYAALSGDWNPIHLWSWSARMMGMRRPILHGMHTVAKACAVLQQSTAATITKVDCYFRSPVPLGSIIVLMNTSDADMFTTLNGQRIAVQGNIFFSSANSD